MASTPTPTGTMTTPTPAISLITLSDESDDDSAVPVPAWRRDDWSPLRWAMERRATAAASEVGPFPPEMEGQEDCVCAVCTGITAGQFSVRAVTHCGPGSATPMAKQCVAPAMLPRRQLSPMQCICSMCNGMEAGRYRVVRKAALPVAAVPAAHVPAAFPMAAAVTAATAAMSPSLKRDAHHHTALMSTGRWRPRKRAAVVATPTPTPTPTPTQPSPPPMTTTTTMVGGGAPCPAASVAAAAAAAATPMVAATTTGGGTGMLRPTRRNGRRKPPTRKWEVAGVLSRRLRQSDAAATAATGHRHAGPLAPEDYEYLVAWEPTYEQFGAYVEYFRPDWC